METPLVTTAFTAGINEIRIFAVIPLGVFSMLRCNRQNISPEISVQPSAPFQWNYFPFTTIALFSDCANNFSQNVFPVHCQIQNAIVSKGGNQPAPICFSRSLVLHQRAASSMCQLLRKTAFHSQTSCVL